MPINFSNAADLASRLKGKILLQVESNGEAWYVNPEDEKRYYLGRPADAFQVMRELGLGISSKDFGSFNGYAPKRLSGKILLKVEDSGKAYYVNPDDLELHYLGQPKDAFDIMRNLGIGISNKNLNNIEISKNINDTSSSSDLVLAHYAEEEEIRLRDIRRFSNARQIDNEIMMFHLSNDRLPSDLNELYENSFSDAPADIKPNLECGEDFNYELNIFSDTDDYEIIFCQERGTYGREIGKNSIVSDKEFSTTDTIVIDTDSDGLNDYVEKNIFYTDINKNDSDGDGYNDFLEVGNCFNPVGSGNINLFDTPEKTIFAITFLKNLDTTDKVNWRQFFLDEITSGLEITESEFKNYVIGEVEDTLNDITQIKEIKYKHEIDADNIHIAANVLYKNENSGVLDVYFVKNNNEWFINIEPELLMIRKNDSSWESFKNSFDK